MLNSTVIINNIDKIMKFIVNFVVFLFAYSLMLNIIVSSEDVLQDVKLRYYYGSTDCTKPNIYIEFKLNETVKLLNDLSFNRNRATITYIHGWNEKMNESETLLAIVESYLSRNDHNVLLLNYEKFAENFYPTVVEHAEELGKRVARAFSYLFINGLDEHKIHLIGYSLGAHICGEIGRALQPTYMIPRITGLDPAFPMYYGTSGGTKYIELNKYDAKFVDIIHTDQGLCGAPKSSGHADFWSETSLFCGVRRNASLGRDHCAHDASVHYYAQSVTATKKIFIATNRLNPNDIVQMGYNCPNTAFGDYDLNTDI